MDHLVYCNFVYHNKKQNKTSQPKRLELTVDIHEELMYAWQGLDTPEDLLQDPLGLLTVHLKVGAQQVQAGLVHSPHPPVLVLAVKQQEDHHDHVDAAVSEDLALVVVELPGDLGLGGVEAGEALQEQLRRNPTNIPWPILRRVSGLMKW